MAWGHGGSGLRAPWSLSGAAIDPAGISAGDQGDGAVQAGEAAGATAVAGGHVDTHPLAADLDRLLGQASSHSRR